MRLKVCLESDAEAIQVEFLQVVGSLRFSFPKEENSISPSLSLFIYVF